MKLRYLALPLSILAASSVVAETDGTLGATSEGSTDVSITISDLVQVSVEQDVALTQTLGSDSTGATGVCIYRNSDADVDVTLTSTNPSATNQFQLSDGTNVIPYVVDLTGTSTNATDVASASTTTVTDENNVSADCGGAFPHSVDVTVAQADLESAQAGNYSDTITILVQPN